MRINTDFYTTAQEEVTGRSGMKRFTKTFKAMLADGELPVNEEWDLSISPFAINPRSHPDASYASDIPNKCWIFPDINRLSGIASDTPEDPEMVLRPHMYKRQTYYPFMMYSQDGGQGNGWAFPYYPGRVGYEQTAAGDFTNYKWNMYGITQYSYNRLVWLIRVFVADYGHNNTYFSPGSMHYGSWYTLADITDALWTEILSGVKDITGVRFIPYYANGSSLTSRQESLVTGLYAMPQSEGLDSSSSGLGILAPYTEDYIDYALATYAAIGTEDSEGARGGNPTLALGCIGEYGNNTFSLGYIDIDYNWHPFDSLAQWANTHFRDDQAYQKNGTDSVFWVNEPHQVDGYQTLYFRQHLNTDILTTKELCREYLITQCAYLGGYFTDNYVTAASGALNDTDMYLGIIEDDGMTAGRYQRGTGIVDPDIDDPWEDIGWEPPPPDPDPNEYDDNTTVLNGLHLNPEFSTRYCMTRTQLAHAHNFLMSEIATNVDSDFWAAQTLYTNDPMDVVQSVMLFPFDISNYQTDEPSYMDLSFGQLIDTGYQVQLNRESYCVIDMGGCTYFPKMGNGNLEDFRNYPPYSSALLYIPYCGSVEIDPNLYMGQSISVKMIVDMGTGACLALVYRNNMVVDSISGTIGVTIPITGIQTQTLAAAQRQAETQLKTAKMSSISQLATGAASIAGGAAAGGLIGAAGAAAYQLTNGSIAKSVLAIRNAQFNLEHINVPYKTIGTASSTTSYANERKCRLIIRRPVMLTEDLTDYAHSVGFACLTPGIVSDFSGYTEFESVDLSGITATAAEKDMLMKLLQSGVYI